EASEDVRSDVRQQHSPHIEGDHNGPELSPGFGSGHSVGEAIPGPSSRYRRPGQSAAFYPAPAIASRAVGAERQADGSRFSLRMRDAGRGSWVAKWTRWPVLAAPCRMSRHWECVLRVFAMDEALPPSKVLIVDDNPQNLELLEAY